MLRSLVLGSIIVSLGCATAPAPAAAPKRAEPAVIAVTEAMGDPHLGQSAPDFALTDQSGNALALSSLRGSVVVLAFVTSWCPFSKASQPHLAALAAELAPRGVRVVAVDVGEGDDGYQKYVDRVAMPLPVLRDSDGAVARSYAPPGAQPHVKKRSEVPIAGHVVIDADGVIRYFGLADLARYDATLTHVRRAVDALAPPKVAAK